MERRDLTNKKKMANPYKATVLDKILDIRNNI